MHPPPLNSVNALALKTIWYPIFVLELNSFDDYNSKTAMLCYNLLILCKGNKKIAGKVLKKNVN